MYTYRAVGNRCAVCLDSFDLPVPNDQALTILWEKGFRVVEVDMLALAYDCVGVSQYRLGARISEAPQVFNCSSMTKWLYSKRGIWLPRLAIQQRGHEGKFVLPEEVDAGDLVFVSGANDYYLCDPTQGVGHVGIATSDGRVIHAADKYQGVVVSTLGDFIREGRCRGVKRYISEDAQVLTLEVPPGRGVDTSDDIRWIILESLPW